MSTICEEVKSENEDEVKKSDISTSDNSTLDNSTSPHTTSSSPPVVSVSSQDKERNKDEQVMSQGSSRGLRYELFPNNVMRYIISKSIMHAIYVRY